MADLLGRIVFAVPSGVLFVQDYDNRVPAPDWEHDRQVVSASRSGMRIRATHGQIGLTDVEIFTGDLQVATPTLLYEGQLELALGRMRIIDANEESGLVIGIAPGPHEIKVYGDPSPWPRHVMIIVDNP
jgi:hypothetical protein